MLNCLFVCSYGTGNLTPKQFKVTEYLEWYSVLRSQETRPVRPMPKATGDGQSPIGHLFRMRHIILVFSFPALFHQTKPLNGITRIWLRNSFHRWLTGGATSRACKPGRLASKRQRWMCVSKLKTKQKVSYRERIARTRDAIDHVTNRFATCHFLLVSHWNRASSTVFEIFEFGTKTRMHTYRHTLRVILYSFPCNVLHWTDNNIIDLTPGSTINVAVRPGADSTTDWLKFLASENDARHIE